MSLRGRAAIVGVAELPPRRDTSEYTSLEMIARVARLAVLDAGMTPSDIDGLMVGPQVGETPQHVPATIAEYLGLEPRFADIVDLGGATAAAMAWRAAAAISAGMATAVLCVLGNTRNPGVVPRSPNRNPIREFDVPFGASGANQAYAMIAQAHMAAYGTTSEQLAHVPVKQRLNAQLNPEATFFGKPITIEDVLGSPMVMEPLHLLEIVMPCGGGAAFVVVAAERAPDHPHAPVFLLGAGESVTHRALSQAPRLTSSPLAAAIGHAYATAGVGPSDLDLLSIYDCYSIVVAITLEDAGICAPGEGGHWIAESDMSHRGRLPVNTHGGQLGMGQSDLAGGMGHIVEAVLQLRHGAGDRQIDGVETALVTGNGATMSEEVALVLGRTIS